MHLVGHFNNTGIATSCVSISIEKALKILLIARPYIQPVKRLLMLQSVVENLNYSHSFKILVKKFRIYLSESIVDNTPWSYLAHCTL